VKTDNADRTENLRIAAVQMNSPGTLAENVARIAVMAQRAARAGAKVALFPECATTGYAGGFEDLSPVELREALHEVGRLASGLDVHLLVGTPMFAGRNLFNTLAVFDRSGRLTHVYAKCHLTPGDRRWFTPGNSLSFFDLDGLPATAFICHERRYPELVRLPVMAGARLVFHPNAGLDALAVSKAKRNGRDGIVARAFENAVPYVFANTVGPQRSAKWSAGDSKIVGADARVLKLADNVTEGVIVASVDLTLATRKYATDALEHPRFLRAHWKRVLDEVRPRTVASDRRFLEWYRP
jgi:predicted amidohydrolase